MKKWIKLFIILSLICCAVVIIYNYLSNRNGWNNGTKISMHQKTGSELPNNISAMLCYSNGHSEIAKSETFFYRKNNIAKSKNQYLSDGDVSDGCQMGTVFFCQLLSKRRAESSRPTKITTNFNQ